jgi:hypothetical protein
MDEVVFATKIYMTLSCLKIFALILTLYVHLHAYNKAG